MALETHFNSNGQNVLPIIASVNGAGELLDSFSSSMSFQKNEPSEAGIASQFGSSLGNLSDSVLKMAQSNANLPSNDINSIVFKDSISSGPSFGASSLVTDADSPLLGSSYLQGSGRSCMGPYLNLPSPPMSFSSSNLSTSVIHGSSAAEHISHLDQNSKQGKKRQQSQREMGASVTRCPASQARQVSLHTEFKEEANALVQVCKKSRMDTNYNDILHQRIVHQLLQKPDSMQLQHNGPQLQALIQQHALHNQLQQQSLHPASNFPRLQMQHHSQQQATAPRSTVQAFDGGICPRRLMQYMYHLRHHPNDNSIAYWRKFVAEYYAPCAKKRWCLSLYENIGQHALGVFSQAAVDAWHCDICGSKAGKGFEANFEILPRLIKMQFECVLDELLFLDLPRECRFPSGLMMLEYEKAVHESVFEQFRVVREGKLRIVFRQDLKIISWEFCSLHHEELLLRRMVAPQVNQLIQAARKYHNSIKDNEAQGVSVENLQSSCNMFLIAGRKLARNLELSVVNDLGFSKRYIRCLQIAEVFNSMKDLMSFSLDRNTGPIESLKSFLQKDMRANIQPQEMQELQREGCYLDLLTDRNSVHPSRSSNRGVGYPMSNDGLSDSCNRALMLTNYYQKLLGQKSSTFNSAFLGHQSSISGMLQNSPTGAYQCSPANNSSQDYMIDKLVDEMLVKARQKGVELEVGKVKERAASNLQKSSVFDLPNTAKGTGTYCSQKQSPIDAAAACVHANLLANLLGSTPRVSEGNPAKAFASNISIKKEPGVPDFN